MPQSKRPVTVTKAALTSKAALRAASLAAYRMRHNARYRGWSDDQRLAKQLAAAFDAAAKADQRAAGAATSSAPAEA